MGGGGVGFLYWRQNRKLKDMDVVDRANIAVDKAHDTIGKLMERISADNSALDGKTDQIRKLTDRLYDSERDKDRLNDEIKALLPHKEWVCVNGDCENRCPANPKLRGKTFPLPLPVQDEITD